MPDFLEKAFGGNALDDVRVHQGPAAPALGAHAYAQGSDLHFAPGGGASGGSLLGHELAHVVQQREGRVAASPAAAAEPFTGQYD